MRSPFAYVSVFALALVLLCSFLLKGAPSAGELSMAELEVKKLTCSSCVQKIDYALSAIDGIGSVEVSVTTGRARVEYDARKVGLEAIVEGIGGAGYPAEPLRSLSAAEYRDLKEDAGRLAATYVARIGERLVSREDFEGELARARARYGNSAVDGTALMKKVWQELEQRELLLLAAERNGVVVQDGEVELEMERMRRRTEGFDAGMTRRFGSLEAYARRLKSDMIITRNLEEHVDRGEKDPNRRRFKRENWFRTLQGETPVTLFDPALKAAAGGGKGGCGGCC